jgi:hypothetical protein
VYGQVGVVPTEGRAVPLGGLDGVASGRPPTEACSGDGDRPVAGPGTDDDVVAVVDGEGLDPLPDVDERHADHGRIPPADGTSTGRPRRRPTTDRPPDAGTPVALHRPWSLEPMVFRLA